MFLKPRNFTNFWSLAACAFSAMTASLVAITFVSAAPSVAEKSSVTAIDIVIQPDETMRERALKANAELRKDYPRGFALDDTHNPHITLLQRYVKTEDLEKVFAAAAQIVRKEHPTQLKMEAFKYYYGKMGATGLQGIVVKTTPEMLKLQKELIDAVAPYSVPSGGVDAFVTTPGETDIDQFTQDFVGTYVEKAAGEKFNPHVTTGIGNVVTLDKIMAKPFEQFESHPAGVAVYQLGAYGTARKLLKQF